jgi:long-subunit acyl-CoA synthetase (AMP-forming)
MWLRDPDAPATSLGCVLACSVSPYVAASQVSQLTSFLPHHLASHVGRHPIHKGIVAQVNASGALRKSIFSGAMSVRRATAPPTQRPSSTRSCSPISDHLAFCGGAPLSQETQEFLATALVTIVQGTKYHDALGLTN